jgi:hypothetical protein
VSVVYFNLITVTGPRPAVLAFRHDALRQFSPSLRKAIGLPRVDLSLEKLFRKHRLAAPSSDGIPDDGGDYCTRALPMTEWNAYARTLYEFHIKNNEIHAFLVPLSRCYRELCFVDSEICLDDGSITSVYVSRGRASTWEPPEDRQNFHWERAAKEHGVANLDDAYEDDEVRSDVEDSMLLEALRHWDQRVLRVLRKRSQSSKQCGSP